MDSSHVTVKGSQVYYETVGEGGPLLLLHGGFGTTHDFDGQIPALSRHFKVVAFERPGHGHTADTEGPFTYQSMADSTAEFIETLDLGPSNVVGWSDGAIVALLLSISRPELVKRLVSIGGCFNADSLEPESFEWIKSATPESFRRGQPLLVKRYETASPDGPAHFAEVFSKTKKLWLTEPSILPVQLAKISAPTLVMAGDHDAITMDHTMELYKSINGAKLSIVPGTTHMLLSEKPQLVTSILLDFLGAV